MASPIVRFEPAQSAVDAAFFARLATAKLNTLRLSEAPLSLHAFFTASHHPSLPAPITLDSNALDAAVAAVAAAAGDESAAGEPPPPWPPGRHVAPVTLTLLNTVESFRTADTGRLLRNAAESVVAAITTGAAEADPSLLCPVLLLCFADLKAHVFLHWACFPALALPIPAALVSPASPFDAAVNPSVAEAAVDAVASFRSPFADAGRPAPFACLLRLRQGGGATCHPLADWSSLESGGGGYGGDGTTALCFADGGGDGGHPGWALRNLLALASLRWLPGGGNLTVVCTRGAGMRPDPAKSLLLRLVLPPCPVAWVGSVDGAAAAAAAAVGWEANPAGRVAPRRTDLSAWTDPAALAAQAVDLNLRLMKWRALPGLDAPKLGKLRCLLLGAGTLGCAVARQLMAWGVRDITLLDSGRVSYSNPVRQGLYEHADCLEGGRPKAQAAAEALRRISPAVRSSHAHLAIPMPGHAVAPGSAAEAAAWAACQGLESLVSSADAVFLLTDSRESRWLPTVLCASAGVVAIDVALGFDSFLVMRHGPRQSPGIGLENDTGGAGQGGESGGLGGGGRCRPAAGSPPLGCYFCSDVVAPIDSSRDRSLDEMCTVTRPGLAPVAASLAVELLVGLAHHPMGGAAPADALAGAAPSPDSPLGLLPHQIRGFLSRWQQLLLTGAAFPQCTACSEPILAAWAADPRGLLLTALNSPRGLEDLTGLTALHASAAAADVDGGGGSDDDGWGEGEGGSGCSN